MRRNWDTIRDVLLAVEAGNGRLRSRLDGDVQLAHFEMLREGGFAIEIGIGPELTWAGHDLLDAIRDDLVWGCCRKAIALNGGGLPTDVLLTVARRAIDLLAHDAARREHASTA